MNLRCPYCGDKIIVNTEYIGPAYLSEQTPVGFECDDYKCGAEWDIDGNVTTEGKTNGCSA